MTLQDVLGKFGFSSFNFSNIIDKLYFYVGIGLVLLLFGLIIGFFIWVRRRKNKTAQMVTIGWWEEIGDRLEPTFMEQAEELVIPGTTLRLFYVKKKDLYLPRFTKGIKTNLFYVAMTPNRQMVNFTLPGISKDMKMKNVDYDHTDMIWASENLREYVKRNYKDKAIKWWQAYQGAITTAIYILVITFSLVIILFFMRGIVEDIGVITDKAGILIDKAGAIIDKADTLNSSGRLIRV